MKMTGARQEGWVFKSIFLLCIFGTFLSALVVGAVLWHFSRGLPNIIQVSDYRPLVVSRVVARVPQPGGQTGQLGNDGAGTVDVGEFFKERRYLVPYDEVSDLLIRAFVSAEDDRFFEHPGINFLSILRASIANFKAGHVVQGGSTITQQVAKSLLLTPEKSFDRKIKEVILANRIERHLTKQQILYLYLNQIYLGHGAYGVQAACKTYFRKNAKEVSLAEAALLAGLPQAPGKYSPVINPKRAKERQLYVLRRMVENKYISADQMREAATQPLKIYHDENLNLKYSPYFVENVRKYLNEKYGQKAVNEDGLTAIVTLNPNLASTATKSVKAGLLAVDKRIGYRGPVKHLTSAAEIEKFSEDQRVELLDRRLHFKVFQSDGTLDGDAALRDSGLNEASLIEPDELYEGVVRGFSPQRKGFEVQVGRVVGVLDPASLKWARAGAQGKTFAVGDVIMVSAAHRDVQKLRPEVVFNLEQEPLLQGSLVSVDVQSGDVLAMVGGSDFEKSEFNRVIQAMRQPGSAFKPIIYAAALEKGYTPASIIVDSPIVFKDNEGAGTWKPNNFEEKFYGDTTFRQALIKSRNIPTIKLVQSVQVNNIIQYAKRLGMNAQVNADLSLALGSASVSLMDLVKTYAIFPRLGRKLTPRLVLKVVDRDGRVLEESASVSALPQEAPSPGPSPSVEELTSYPRPGAPDQVMDPRIAFVMTHLMKEVVAYGTGHGAKTLGRVAAGKTGTTNDYVDAWFLGFTPSIVTGSWVGFDVVKSIGPGETGAKAALPIWLNFMRDAVQYYPDSDFSVPPGIVFASIDATSGKLAAPNSSSAIREAFIDGTQPTEVSGDVKKPAESQADFFKEDRD